MCSHMCSLMCSEAVCVFIPSFFDFRGSEGPFSCKEIMTQAQKRACRSRVTRTRRMCSHTQAENRAPKPSNTQRALGTDLRVSFPTAL
jgi:hypothetical protein